MDRQARRPARDEPPPDVVEGGQAAGRKPNAPDVRRGQTVVAPSQETAGPHQRKSEPDTDGHPIEEGGQRLARPVEVNGRSGDREQEAPVGGASRIHDRPPGESRDRLRDRAQRLEKVAADERPDVGPGNRVSRVLARSAVARRQLERQRRAEERGQRCQLEVLGAEPDRQTVPRQPRDEQRPHRRFPRRNPSGASSQTITASRGCPRPGAVRQPEPSSGGALQESSDGSPPLLHELLSS
jgi:hypothetical protein